MPDKPKNKKAHKANKATEQDLHLRKQFKESVKGRPGANRISEADYRMIEKHVKAEQAKKKKKK